ncbi:MAG TPA: hypothetical protein VGH51_18955 [Candidatus Angelobacter sp.]|jgi:hypothetical protein
MKSKAIYLFVVVLFISLVSWSQGSKPTKASAPADWKDVDAAMGRAGQDQPDGTHKFSLPRKDMNVTVSGLQIKARAGAGIVGGIRAFRQVGYGDGRSCAG